MMAFSAWELLELAGSPRHPWGELRLLMRLLELEKPVALPLPAQLTPSINRPAFAKAA